MSTAKELFLQMLNPRAVPERQICQYEAFEMVLGSPIMSFLMANRGRGTVSKDRWGTTIAFAKDAPGPTPIINAETKVCPDVTRWREYVHAPNLVENCSSGWEDVAASVRAKAGEERIVTAFMATGIFEQTHFLLGFEDTLTNLYEHPQEMHELIDYITDYRIGYAKLLIDNLQPDAIFSHDDWGTKAALFMSPEMWRDYLKEPYRRLYGYIRSRGVMVIHHADSFLVPVVEDMVEIGIQAWQGVLPENDIPSLQKQLQGRMILMGGIGAAIDRPDATEQEIREYVRSVLRKCCPGGHFIPCITYGIPGTIYPHVNPIINEEINAYNRELHLPDFRFQQDIRRTEYAVESSGQRHETKNEDDVLSRLSVALCKGQKKRVLQYTEEALSAGIPAGVILNNGLLPGMSRLGEDFSGGKAFVPEMLLGARCMNAATELLKPLLSEETAGISGKACIGTVKGDLHDIGKNLVRIMLEGSGLQVIDLGVDVSAETFVTTAAEQNCDFICCSSLLTTTMNEMRKVVSLAEENGIRSKVKILVGGAPITQGFCNEIGADIYTPDAAQAAKAAVACLKGRLH